MSEFSHKAISDPYSDRAIELRGLFSTDPFGAVRELKKLAPKSVSCMLLLGQAFEEGRGTAPDSARAEQWFKRAADLGSPRAHYFLGDHYIRQRKYTEAKKAYGVAASMGDADARASLSWLDDQRDQREADDLFEADPTQGLPALRRLAERGSLDSMLQVGWAYENGVGASVNKGEAAKWYQLAYEMGSELAGQYLGFYEFEQGCMEQAQNNYSEAVAHFSKGADYMFAPAMFRLAELYARGLGVTRDRRKARELYEHAASLGNLAALRTMAKWHLLGRYGLAKITEGIRLYGRFLVDVFTVAGKEDLAVRMMK